MKKKRKPSREEELLRVTIETIKFLTEKIGKHKLNPLEVLGMLTFLEWTAVYGLIATTAKMRKIKKEFKYIG